MLNLEDQINKALGVSESIQKFRVGGYMVEDIFELKLISNDGNKEYKML